jgi:hypothetical protein
MDFPSSHKRDARPRQTVYGAAAEDWQGFWTLATAPVAAPQAPARKVGEQERLFHYLHAYGGLIPVQVLHIRGKLDPALVRRALAYLQRLHPVLRAHVRYEGLVFVDKPPFLYRQPWLDTRGTTEIPLTVIDDPDPAAWERRLERELKKPLPKAKNPRVRVTLVRENPDAELNHVIFAADHVSADAQATNMASRHFLEYLADPQKAEERQPIHAELPAPLEFGMPQRSRSGSKTYEKPIRLPHRRVPGGRQLTRQVRRRIGAGEAEALRLAVKANKTTLHGALSAAFLVAIREKYGLPEMTMLSTVDMRRLCKPPFPSGTYGCYIDLLRTKHAIDRGFWAIAQDVAFGLIQTIARDQEAASIMKLWGWEFYRDEAWPMLTHARRMDGLAVTTAGPSGLGRAYGPFTLEDVTMAVSTVMFGVSLFVISAEREDDIDLFVCYADYATAKADVEELTDRAVAALRRAIELPATAAAAQ